MQVSVIMEILYFLVVLQIFTFLDPDRTPCYARTSEIHVSSAVLIERNCDDSSI